MKFSIPTLSVLLVLVGACATGSSGSTVQPALPMSGSAYDAALRVELPQAAPEESPGLHNVFRLSDNIVSGSEPEGEAALQKIAAMGVKTVLSVDGKAPDHDIAAKYGLRYVHVPIRYRGIEPDEIQAIAKTFQELEGPFYVHCFHGKHRGPAAAAVGRVVLDGATRDQAIAEMRQWCGTSSKYEGLYATIAFGDLPSAAESAAYQFDFAPVHTFRGFRSAMVDLARSWDTVEALSKREWAPDPSHPDASARNEAAKMVDIYEQSAAMDECRSAADDFRGWLDASLTSSKRLADALRAFEQGDKAAGEAAKQEVASLKKLCSSCHGTYRNSGS
jgi:protein tyrosine phosphatase (PTP) superfamily phosphohydrolase (DUF442 family)